MDPLRGLSRRAAGLAAALTPARLVAGALWLRDFAVFVAGRFVADRGLQVAAALAYTSLLSLVPLMAVTFSTLAAFPGFRSIGQDIQDFVFSNFVPAAGEVVQSHLQGFAAKASQLTTVGIVVLMVTALMMISTIDRSLNDIWRTRGRRSGVARFMVYWALLTLGPILIGAGLVATSYLSSLPFVSDVEAAGLDIRKTLLVWAPFLSTTLAFTLLYVLVPSRTVPLRPALVGGVVAALLFETAKRGFAWYVTQFPTYEAIYGALASVPIFLIWIYVSWVIILLGAEVAHCLLIFHKQARAGPGREEMRFVATLRLVGWLWQGQRDGRPLSEESLVEREPGLDEDTLGQLLADLQRHRIVQRTDAGEWILARDASRLSALHVYRAVPGPVPALGKGPVAPADAWGEVLGERLREADAGLERALDIPIAELVAAGDGHSVAAG